MEQQMFMIKNFLRIIYPNIHLRRMTYPPERKKQFYLHFCYNNLLVNMFTTMKANNLPSSVQSIDYQYLMKAMKANSIFSNFLERSSCPIMGIKEWRN